MAGDSWLARRLSRSTAIYVPTLDLSFAASEADDGTHDGTPSTRPSLTRQNAVVSFASLRRSPRIRQRRNAIAHYGSITFTSDGRPAFVARTNSTASSTLRSVLPSRRLSGRSASGLGPDQICAICCDDMRADDRVACMPCGGHHVYHERCLQRWLNTSETESCPKCRWTMVEDVPASLTAGVARAEAYLDSLRNSD